MLKLLVAGLLAASVAVEAGGEQKPIDPAQIKQAVTRLELAFKSGDTAERIAAIQAGVELPDAEVAKGIGEGLKDKQETVVAAAVDGLGNMRHTEALTLLETFYKQNKKRLHKDSTLFAALLKSCARHGQDSSIEILSEDPFSVVSYDVLQARIYGLGNIRSKDSIEALVGMSRKTSRNNLDRYADEFRVALFNITGVDQGKSPDLWGTWWREHEKTFQVPMEVPELPPEMLGKWNRYWGLERAKDKRPND